MTYRAVGSSTGQAEFLGEAPDFKPSPALLSLHIWITSRNILSNCFKHRPKLASSNHIMSSSSRLKLLIIKYDMLTWVIPMNSWWRKLRLNHFGAGDIPMKSSNYQSLIDNGDPLFPGMMPASHWNRVECSVCLPNLDLNDGIVSEHGWERLCRSEDFLQRRIGVERGCKHITSININSSTFRIFPRL